MTIKAIFPELEATRKANSHKEIATLAEIKQHDSAYFDRKVLDRIAEHSPKNGYLAKRVARLYLKKGEHQINKIQSGLSQLDYSATLSEVPELLTSSKSIGATGIVEICNRLLKTSRYDFDRRLSNSIALELRECFRNTSACLKKHYKRLV